MIVSTAPNDNSTAGSNSPADGSDSAGDPNPLLQATNPSNAAVKTGFGHHLGGILGYGRELYGGGYVGHDSPP